MMKSKLPSKPFHQTLNDTRPEATPAAGTVAALVEANKAGQPPPTGAGEVFLNAVQLRQRYGITDMGLWRWIKEENFPVPMTIGNRRYWKLSEIQAFEIRQTGKPVKHLDQINAARKSKNKVKA